MKTHHHRRGHFPFTWTFDCTLPLVLNLRKLPHCTCLVSEETLALYVTSFWENSVSVYLHLSLKDYLFELGGSVYMITVTILTQACLLENLVVCPPLFVPGLEGPVSHPPKGGNFVKEGF